MSAAAALWSCQQPVSHCVRVKTEPLPLMPVGVGVRAVPLLVPMFPLPLPIPLSAVFSGMRGVVASGTMGGRTAAIPGNRGEQVFAGQATPPGGFYWLPPRRTRAVSHTCSDLRSLTGT